MDSVQKKESTQKKMKKKIKTQNIHEKHADSRIIKPTGLGLH
jgi:hypothetical protein